MITLFAMLTNIEYWEEIEEFGKMYFKALKRYLELPNGIPSHDTIQRVMATIEPEVTEVLLRKWMDLKISGEDKKIRKISTKSRENQEKKIKKATERIKQIDRLLYLYDIISSRF